jgi:hypothetical protein
VTVLLKPFAHASTYVLLIACDTCCCCGLPPCRSSTPTCQLLLPHLVSPANPLDALCCAVPVTWSYSHLACCVSPAQSLLGVTGAWLCLCHQQVRVIP